MHRDYFNRLPHMVDLETLTRLNSLNLKTLQNWSYLRPDELLDIRSPEVLVSKQFEVMISNMHKTLDYWNELVKIGEETAQTSMKNVRNVVNESEEMVRKQAHVYTANRDNVEEVDKKSSAKSKK